VRLALALSLVVPLCLANVTRAQPANDCTDPYWQDTLRCATFPQNPPQPNFDSSPTDVADMHDFTRVFLNSDFGVRCLDGTRPIMYVDTAVGGPSNKWIISMTGGGSCHARDSLGSGVVDDAQECLDIYANPQERDEMGTAFKPPMKTLTGINLPDPARNPVFSGYNRVRVEKCSYDRYNGRVAYEAVGGYFQEIYPRGAMVNFNMYQQGYRIMAEALQALQNSLTYTTWVPMGAGGTACDVTTQVCQTQEALPPLADAERVLFVGHSGAAHGLFHNIDHLAASLALMPGFAGDVRVVFDANFIESIENEAAFATDASGNLLNGDAYSNLWTGQSAGNGVAFSYDGATYYATDRLAEQYDSWTAAFDASCLEVHVATGDDWKCRDRYHVLFHHISTPFFFREDFTDPNQEHTRKGFGHPVLWGDQDNYPHCATAGSSPCVPLFTVSEHRDRLEQQYQTLLEGSHSRSELATGDDTSLRGAGVFPTWFAWMPSCRKHEGVYDNASFYNTTMSYMASTNTMREWLERFASAERTNVRRGLVDGWVDASGNVMMTRDCR
jgi:hypothetical protein